MQDIISIEDWEKRKDFIQFGDKDIEAVSWIQPMAEFFVNEVVDALYEHLLQYDLSRQYLPAENQLEGLKQAQKTYFMQLFSGEYGDEYLASRVIVGCRHAEVGLPLHIFIATYAQYFMLIRPHIFEYIDDEDDAFRVLDALAKLITLDESVALEAFSAVINSKNQK